MLVDLCLPKGGDGEILIRRARHLWGTRCISVVLTAHRKEELLIDAIRGGAKGFIDKSLAPQAWQNTVEVLAAGQSPLNASLAHIFHKELQSHSQPKSTSPNHAKLFDFLRQISHGALYSELAEFPGLTVAEAGLLARYAYDAQQTTYALSPRELQYINLVSTDLTPQERAATMGLPVTTIKKYGQRLCTKLNVETQFEAIIEARRQGLIA
jgi:DNA-binding NarL/FixJ family response regulator